MPFLLLSMDGGERRISLRSLCSCSAVKESTDGAGSSEHAGVNLSINSVILMEISRLRKSELRGNVADQWKEQKLWGNAVCPAGSYYLNHSGSGNLVEEFEIPDLDETLRNMEEAAKRLYEETDLSICLGESVTDLQVAPGGSFGIRVLMKEEPDIMRALLQKCLEAGLKQINLPEIALRPGGEFPDMAHIRPWIAAAELSPEGKAREARGCSPNRLSCESRFFPDWKKRS